MRIVIVIVALFLSSSFVMAQDMSLMKITASGLKYYFIKDAETPSLQVGNIMKMNFIMLSEKDSTLRNSWLESGSTVAQAKPSLYSGSLEEAFLMMSAGDSAWFLISADSMFKNSIKQPLPAFVRPGSFFKFLIKMDAVYTPNEYQEELKKSKKTLHEIESEKIKKYIAEKGYIAQETPSGLFYVQTQEGTNDIKPQKGIKVKVHYTGRLMDGTKFDSSVDRGEPFQFKIGNGEVIAGWDQGIAMMSKGEKGILIVPSTLGYGNNGAGDIIPPNSILIFDVEMIDFNNR
jgi:peptidylprolyl isomerase